VQYAPLWQLPPISYKDKIIVMADIRNKHKISEYIQRTDLSHIKDYASLANGLGFVVAGESSVIASINTHCEAAYIALLEFLPYVPRGNHYHLRKIEYMTVLKGRMRCSLRLVDEAAEVTDMILESGQMLRILPGCIHTYTALDDKVIALEFSPQKFELADTITIDTK
jgi:hypothetical protein